MIFIIIIILILIIIFAIFLKRFIYDLAISKGDSEDLEAKKISNLIAVLFGSGSIVILALLGFDYYAHSLATKKPGTHLVNHEEFLRQIGGFLGTFGDFFGGILNPILTFCTLIALGVTILLQRIQLRDARKDVKENRQRLYLQTFETTFFNLLNLHAENVKNLSFDPNVFTNRAQLLRMAKLAGSPPPPARPEVFGRSVFSELLKVTEEYSSSCFTQLGLYRWLQKYHNNVLGHYFRHLYQILKLVDKMQIEGTQEARDKIRKGYTNFLRAQLSSHELAVLFLNCTFKTVDDGKFRDLLIWYKLFEHLPIAINEEGKITSPGISEDEQWIFYEYFDIAAEAPKIWTSGAFGKNPKIKEFLDRQGPEWTGPIPLSRKKPPVEKQSDVRHV